MHRYNAKGSEEEEKKLLRPGHGRVEFLAVKDELNALLDKGYSLKNAYDELKNAGKITGSYSTIYRHYVGIASSRTKITMKQNVERKKEQIVSATKEESDKNQREHLQKPDIKLPSGPARFTPPVEKAADLGTARDAVMDDLNPEKKE